MQKINQELNQESNLEELNMSSEMLSSVSRKCVMSIESLVSREVKLRETTLLKQLKKLNLLSVSIKDAKARLRSGVGVAVMKKLSGRPKKVERVVCDDDIIADLTAKADVLTEPRLLDEDKKAKALAKAKLKEEKALAKAKAKEEKALAKAKLKEEKALLKAKLVEEKNQAKALAKAKLKQEKALAKAKLKEEKALAKAKAKEEKALAKAKAKEEKALAKAKLKEEKAAKAAAKLEKKSKAAKAAQDKLKLKNQLLEEEPMDVDIKDEAGEVVGNKVESFNVPQDLETIKKMKSLKAAGLTAFTHSSLPNDELYIDNDQCVFKWEKPECIHIGNFDSENGVILPISDSEDECSDSEDEAANLYLSDTE